MYTFLENVTGLPGSDYKLNIVVDSIFPLTRAEDAYTRLKANLNTGKIILTMQDVMGDGVFLLNLMIPFFLFY